MSIPALQIPFTLTTLISMEDIEIMKWQLSGLQKIYKIHPYLSLKGPSTY